MPFTITITDLISSRADIEEQKARTLTDDTTGEKITQTYDHRESISLGDYAIWPQIKDPATGEVLSDTRGTPLGYDTDRYHADVTARVQPLVGKDLAPFIASAALETAKGEAVKAEAATLMAAAVDAVSAARVQGQALIDDATAQAAQIVEAARQSVAVDAIAEPPISEARLQP